ncbi:hypothetical protein [Paraburkholderia dipogonis]|uniref:hypothetical protein n=1 Tax=Paraburkholderia dipogonis TaxID=1211383 RepID=UPI0038B97C15
MDHNEARQAITDIFEAAKLSEIKKICKNATITEDAFSDFVMLCDAGILPWVHHISWRDFLPPNLAWTDEDSKRLGNIDNGPLTREATKAMRKWYQLLNERRYLVGHVFYLRDHSNWQFFYFDNRDLWAYANHFKGGPHIHLINHLWPNRTLEGVWNEFREGNPEMNGAEHIRFHRENPRPPQL